MPDMPDISLTLVMPVNVAEHVEDLLLAHPQWVRGFTSSPAAGHGSSVALVEPAELVRGNSPRTRIQLVGSQDNLRAVLGVLKKELPHANIFYWIVPVLEMGRLL